MICLNQLCFSLGSSFILHIWSVSHACNAWRNVSMVVAAVLTFNCFIPTTVMQFNIQTCTTFTCISPYRSSSFWSLLATHIIIGPTFASTWTLSCGGVMLFWVSLLYCHLIVLLLFTAFMASRSSWPQQGHRTAFMHHGQSWPQSSPWPKLLPHG